MHGKAARVAGAISGESPMKAILQCEPKVLLYVIAIFVTILKRSEENVS
jgi:hypothetical protein